MVFYKAMILVVTLNKYLIIDSHITFMEYHSNVNLDVIISTIFSVAHSNAQSNIVI